MGDKSKSGQKKVGDGEKDTVQVFMYISEYTSITETYQHDHRLNPGIHTYRPNKDISLDIVIIMLLCRNCNSSKNIICNASL